MTSTGASTGADDATSIPDDVDEPRAPGPLASQPFRMLWFNNIAYFLVANAERFVFGWLVLDGLDLGEAEQGIVVFAFGLPSALLVLPAGAWADRWDRRRLLMSTQIAGGVVMAATAVLVGTGHVSFSLVILAAVLSGSAAAVGSPVRASLIPALVPKAQLFGAIALNALAMTLSLILGPVLARLAGDLWGFEGAFGFQAALMALGIVFLLRLHVPAHGAPPADDPRRSVLAEVRTGLRFVLDSRPLRGLFGLLLLASLTVNPAVMVTIQAHVKDGLGRPAGDAALPFALMGAGIAITSIFILKRADMKNRAVAFMRAMLCGSSITIGIGLTTSFTVLLVLTFLMGLVGGFFINMNQGLVQSNTPPEMMGRVMGLYTLIAAGLMPVGALLLGGLAAAIGTGAAIAAAGAVNLAIVAATYVRNTTMRELG